MHHRTRGESSASGASRGQRLKGLLSLQVCHCPIHSHTCVGSLQLLRQIDAQPASSRYLQLFRQTGEGNNMTMNENTKKIQKIQKKIQKNTRPSMCWTFCINQRLYTQRAFHHSCMPICASEYLCVWHCASASCRGGLLYQVPHTKDMQHVTCNAMQQATHGNMRPNPPARTCTAPLIPPCPCPPARREREVEGGTRAGVASRCRRGYRV
jgi:hypothetical protein